MLILHRIAMAKSNLSQMPAPPDMDLQQPQSQLRSQTFIIGLRGKFKSLYNWVLRLDIRSSMSEDLEAFGGVTIVCSIESSPHIQVDDPPDSQVKLTSVKALEDLRFQQQTQNSRGPGKIDNTMHSLAEKDVHSKSFSADQFLIDFREQYATEIWSLKAQESYQVFEEALQLMENMLLGKADALIIALEILSGLERTQIVLLSCAANLSSDDFCALACRGRKYKVHDDFSCKFTSFVPGSWSWREIQDSWEKLAKVGQPQI